MGVADADLAAAQPPLFPLPEPAGFWIRVAARVIDSLVVGLVVAVLVGVALFVVPVVEARYVLVALLIGLAIAYYPAMWTFDGQTIGMRLLHLIVVRGSDGGRVRMFHSIFRELVLWLGSQLFYIPVIWVAIDARKRGLHDLAAGTEVHRLPPGASSGLPRSWRAALGVVVIVCLPCVALGGLLAAVAPSITAGATARSQYSALREARTDRVNAAVDHFDASPQGLEDQRTEVGVVIYATLEFDHGLTGISFPNSVRAKVDVVRAADQQLITAGRALNDNSDPSMNHALFLVFDRAQGDWKAAASELAAAL